MLDVIIPNDSERFDVLGLDGSQYRCAMCKASATCWQIDWCTPWCSRASTLISSAMAFTPSCWQRGDNHSAELFSSMTTRPCWRSLILVIIVPMRRTVLTIVLTSVLSHGQHLTTMRQPRGQQDNDLFPTMPPSCKKRRRPPVRCMPWLRRRSYLWAGLVSRSANTGETAHHSAYENDQVGRQQDYGVRYHRSYCATGSPECYWGHEDSDFVPVDLSRGQAVGSGAARLLGPPCPSSYTGIPAPVGTPPHPSPNSVGCSVQTVRHVIRAFTIWTASPVGLQPRTAPSVPSPRWIRLSASRRRHLLHQSPRAAWPAHGGLDARAGCPSQPRTRPTARPISDDTVRRAIRRLGAPETRQALDHELHLHA